MISQFTEETMMPMINTKTKRDEFIVEIRKNKNKNILQKKRMKLYGTIEEGQDPSIQSEPIYTSTSPTEGPESPFQLTPEIETNLHDVYEKFFEILNRQDWNELLPVVRFLRESIGDKDDCLPGKVVVDMGVVPHLLSLLSENIIKYQPLLQVEIVWLLANISAGTSEDTAYLVEQNIIQTLSECLKSNTNEDLQENIMWTLANISGENNLSYRDKIIEAGVIDIVVRELYKTQKNLVYYKTSAWLFVNLVRGRPFPPYDKVYKVIAVMKHLIDCNDKTNTIQQHALLSLNYLSEEVNEAHLKEISKNNLIPKIISFISHNDEKMASNAVKVIGNLAMGNRKWIPNLCEQEIFKVLPTVLHSSHPTLRRDACITLSNLIHKEFNEHKSVIEFGLAILLLAVAGQDQVENRIVATKCIFKFLLNCSLEEAIVLIENDLIEILMQNLTLTNVKLIEFSLMTLCKVFEHGENLKTKSQGYNPFVIRIVQNNAAGIIEALQFHDNENILTRVNFILDKVFKNGPF